MERQQGIFMITCGKIPDLRKESYHIITNKFIRGKDKMDYKMLVLDLDDTLLNKNLEISERTVKTLHRLREMGVEIVIATGRMFSSALPYIKELELTGPVINYNGAYIKEVGKDKLIYHQPIPLDIAKEVIKDSEEAGLYINVYIDDRLFVSELNEKSEIYYKTTGIQSEPVGKLSDFIFESPTKMLIIEEDRDKIQDYLSYFKEKYRGIVEVTQSKAYFIEFMANRVSKGNAIKILSERLNIPLEEIIAIGDGWNDLEMIQTAGLGIAMGNAPAGVRKEADKVAGDHDNEGVSNVLAEIFSI